MSVKRSEIQVTVDQLELGMRVTRLDRPWLETDFLLQGFIIDSQDDIDALVRQCKYVYVESQTVSKTPDMERRDAPAGLFARFSKRPAQRHSVSSNRPAAGLGKHRPTPDTRIAHINKISTERELGGARVTYGDAKQSVKSIMDGLRIGRAIDINQSRAAVNSIVDSVLRNKDALIWLTKIKSKDEYTAEHSLNVCVLSATFARYLGHDKSEIQQIALCGLLHDVGKSKIPDEVLNKEGRFSDEEFELMKQHTTFGRDLLMSVKNSDRIAIDVAHCHHERMDGSGYPRGLKSHQIPYYAKLVALADCYDAITSSRCYDGARASMDALDIIYKCKGIQFDEELALEFIKCIGVFPPGAIVELNSGHVGIVISNKDDNKLRPKILVVRDKDKQPIKERVIDLSAPDDRLNAFKISREIANGTYGVDLPSYLKKGLVLEHNTEGKE